MGLKRTVANILQVSFFRGEHKGGWLTPFFLDDLCCDKEGLPDCFHKCHCRDKNSHGVIKSHMSSVLSSLENYFLANDAAIFSQLFDLKYSRSGF